MRITLAGCAMVATMAATVAATVALAGGSVGSAGLDPAETAVESAMADKLVEAAGHDKAALLALKPNGATAGPICYERWQYVFGEALGRARTRSAQALLLSELGTYNLFKTDPIPALATVASGTDVELRVQALRVIAGAGESGAFAADAVTAGLADPDRRVQAAAAGALRYYYFTGLPPAMVAALGRRLEDADQEIRRAALDALINAKDAAPALGGLLAVLGDAEGDLPSRRRAAVLLGRTGSPRAVAPLAAMLSDDSDATRRAAAAGLAGLARRERSEGLRAALERAEDDVDRETKVAGAEGLASLGHLDVALPTLRRMLLSQEEKAREEALRAVGELGKAATPAAPELVMLALNGGDHSDAVAILKKLGPPAAAATLRWLRPAAGGGASDADDDADSTGEVRSNALYLLGKLGPAASATFGAVARLAGDRDDQVREAVARNLGDLAADKAAAARVIEKLVRDRNPRVRRGALEGLRAIGPPAAVAAGSVAAQLADPDATLAVAAGDALADMGKAAAAAARAGLIRAAGDARAEVRGAAGYALVTTGVDAKRGLALVAEAFDAARSVSGNFFIREPLRDAGLRLQAVASRPDATDVVLPAVLRGLKSTDMGKQARAATILDRLGSRAAGAASTMVAALDDQSQRGNSERTASLCHAIAALPSLTGDQGAALLRAFKGSHNLACSGALVIAARRIPDLADALKQAFRGECPYPYGAANAAVNALAAPATQKP
jgi:HEAT repeat protein